VARLPVEYVIPFITSKDSLKPEIVIVILEHYKISIV
jgi:hypothetical protein